MSDNKIRLGNFDMLKAMYDFNASFAKTLSFRENDHFILHQTSTKQRNWWQVVSAKGQMGFVPSNYVTTITVTPQFLIQFLDNCITSLRNDSTGHTADNQELVLRLTEKKRLAELSNHQKTLAAVSPNETTDSLSDDMPKLLFKRSENDHHGTMSGTSYSSYHTASVEDSLRQQDINSTELTEDVSPLTSKKSTTFSPDVSEKNSDGLQNQSSSTEELKNISSDQCMKKSHASSKGLEPIKLNPSRKSSMADVGAKPVYELLEVVRKNTQLSHEKSRIAVVTVIRGIQELLPPNFAPYLNTILTHVEGPLEAPTPMIHQTHDATRLKVIFTELTSCKEDSQQRSWILHEDESIIKEYIHELISILSNADANISKYVMSEYQYSAIVALIQYYQMEVRWSIRQLLLQAFGVMCSLDVYIVNIMLNSVLPMELARDMQTNSRCMQRLNYSSLLLTMIFSMGEKMPITHLEYLGLDFILFLFKLIESPPDTDLDDQIPDLFLNLILAFNLQYDLDADNIVVTAAGQIGEAKILTERILLLLNREEDPVRIFDHLPQPPHSVIKLFIDLFSSTHTADLFYTNDVKVLIDIIVRQLSDISPGDMRRNQYLELCRRVLRNSSYGDHHHRKDDILKCFTRIFCEETEESYADQRLVRKISNEFPEYFKK